MKKRTGDWRTAVTDKVCGDGYCHPACLRTDVLEDQKGFKNSHGRAVEDAVKPYEHSKPVRQDHEQPKVKFSPREAV